MTDPVDVALLGLPGAGKTTYLAALYSSLDDPPPGAPCLVRQPATRAYLEHIRDAWLAGQKVDHTAVGTGELIELDIELAGEQVTLRIPDVSGESFTEALASRAVDAALADVVRASSGVLLFTHPRHLRPRVPITSAIEAGLIDQDAAPGDPTDFDPKLAPTETQLVDLLQWAARLGTARPLRTSVVLSAWDEQPAAKPGTWLRQMPLLKRYLDNSADVGAQVFGVSAQGGEYGGDDDPVTKPPPERPYALTEDGERHADITLPLRWAAGW